MSYPIYDIHVHAGKFSLLRDDIKALLTKKPLEDGIDVKDVFSNEDSLENYLKSRGVCKVALLAECGPGTNFSIDSQMIFEKTLKTKMFIPFGNVNPNFHDIETEFWKSVKMGIRGFKFYPADHNFPATIPKMMYVYEHCEKLNLPIMFHTGLTAQRDAEQLFIKPYEFLPIIEKFSNLKIILAHAGKPHWHVTAMKLALDYENVFLDTALVNVEVIEDMCQSNPKVADKIVFGSDWPVVGSYFQLIDSYFKAKLDPTIIKKILSSNFEKLLFTKLELIC